MRLRSFFLPVLLAYLAVEIVSPALGQTKPPTRTAQAQRSPAQQDAQPADPQIRGQVPPRGPANTQPPNNGAAGRAPQGAAPNQPGGGKGVVQPLRPPQAKVPFVLTAAQEQLLSQILLKWEKESSKVSSFTCSFARWEIDKTWGPKPDYLKSEAKGTIKYKAPDHGSYEVEKLDEWDVQKKMLVKKSEGLDHWVCDGKKIFEFDAPKKQLIERDLPAEMQGKAITDGPLPFIFGAKADQLMKRYWMRDVTPREYVGKEVWLEAWPKRQQDAANFHHATLILSDPAFRPTALQIYLPDGTNHTDYSFEKSSVNSPLALIEFLSPRTPIGWKRVVNPEAETPAAPAANQGQAKRPVAPTTQRK